MLHLHSNLVIFKYLLFVTSIYIESVFTFQSGDIQIICVSFCTISWWLIYIPIWWYSNSDIWRFTYIRPFIYIPIWWYSNAKSAQEKAVYGANLHSNLVIFKWDWQLQILKNICIYIPIWWYSNRCLKG